VLKLGHFGNTRRVLKCGAGERWKKLYGPMSKNKEVLCKEDRNILPKVKRRKANWIGHILRRKCLRKHVIEGNIEGRK
jgi:hypothetical protein